MINTVVIEGIVSIFWRYAMALLFCLACYRDLPPKPLNEFQDVAAFVTLRVVQNNLDTWVHAFLPNRDCAHNLPGFINDGHGTKLLVRAQLDSSELRAPSSSTAVVELRIISQMNGSKP